MKLYEDIDITVIIDNILYTGTLFWDEWEWLIRLNNDYYPSMTAEDAYDACVTYCKPVSGYTRDNEPFFEEFWGDFAFCRRKRCGRIWKCREDRPKACPSCGSRIWDQIPRPLRAVKRKKRKV